MKYKSNLAFKSVGFEYLEDIPNHWEMSRLKSVAELIMGQSPSSSDCSDTPFGLPFLQGCAEFGDIHPNPEQFCLDPPRVVLAGTILMSVRAPVGRLNVADQDYGIGRGLCGIVPNGVTLFDDFAYYQLQVMEDALRLVSTGSTYEAVSTGDIEGQVVAMPTPAEQIAIVAYLDEADQMLRGGVSSKQRLVELMEEYKRAMIQQAVTRGLDPDVPLKPSGVEWLGDIPEHWEVVRLKYCLDKVYSGGTPDSGNDLYYCDPNKGIPWLMISDITDSEYVRSSQKAITEQGRMSKSLDILPSGTLLYSMYASLGSVAILEIDACVNQAILGLSFRTEKVLSKFALYFLQSMQEILPLFSNSSTQANLNAEIVLSLPILIPPLTEQVAIVAHLDKLTSDIDAAIAHTHREIELLEEYRTRLIADVVTGKLDVREPAANLPDVNLDDIQLPAESGEADD